MVKSNWMGHLIRQLGKKRWLPTLVWGITMITVSSIPDLNTTSTWFPGCDKVLHFIEYFVLGIVLRYWSPERTAWFLAGGTGFAALDEFHQSFIPGREASFLDFAADASGLMVGFLASKLFIRKEPNG